MNTRINSRWAVLIIVATSILGATSVSATTLVTNLLGHLVLTNPPAFTECVRTLREFHCVNIVRPPGLTTLPHRVVNTNTAVFRGVVEFGAAQGTWNVYFQYGTHRHQFGLVSSSVVVPFSTGPVPIEIEVTDLEPGQLYFFRLVASNEAGAGSGATRNFVTGMTMYVKSGATMEQWIVSGGDIVSSVPITNMVPPRTQRATTIVDVDGDAFCDVVWSPLTGGPRVSYLPNWSSGSPSFRFMSEAPREPWHVFGAAHMNADLQFDFLAQNAKRQISVLGASSHWIGGITLVGEGRSFGLGWRPIAAADFDNDEDADILFQHTSGRLAIWQLDGDKFVRAVAFEQVPPRSERARGVADVNQDGHIDIVLRDADGTVRVWYLKDGQLETAGPLMTLGLDWSILGIR